MKHNIMIYQIPGHGKPRILIGAHTTEDIDKALNLYRAACAEYFNEWSVIELSVAIREGAFKEGET